MSERKKEMTKPRKANVPPFVGREDAEPVMKPTPQKPETNPEEYPLFKRLDKIAGLLEAKENGIAHQLCRIADALDKIVGNPVPTFVQTATAKPIQSPSTPKPETTPFPKQATQPIIQPTAGTNQVEDVRELFPQDLEGLLVFEDKGDHIRVAPRQYLGSDNFAKIAGVIREAGGEYISDKKNSHFRIPK